MDNAYNWLKTTCGDDSFREIARKAELSDSIISRQLSSIGALSFDVAIAVARAYKTSVLTALVANGHISTDEAGTDRTESALQGATDEQLVFEIARRLDIAPASTLWDSAVSKSVEQSNNVIRLAQSEGIRADDPLAVASEKSGDRGEDTDGYDA